MRDQNRGWLFALLTFVATSAAVLMSAPAVADTGGFNLGSLGPTPNEPASYTVYYKPDMSALPQGTKLESIFQRGSDDSNCLRNPMNFPSAVPTSALMAFITLPGDPFSRCAYTRTFGTFRVTITTPDGATEWTIMKIEQTNSPNIYYMTMETSCSGNGGLNCRGGSDTSSSTQRSIVPAIHFGPLQTGPSGYRLCVGADETCRFSGTKDVAYGADGHYLYKQATGSIACNNATFGSDPIYGTKKACFIK